VVYYDDHLTALKGLAKLRKCGNIVSEATVSEFSRKENTCCGNKFSCAKSVFPSGGPQVKNIFTSRTMAEGDVEVEEPQAGHRQDKGKKGRN